MIVRPDPDTLLAGELGAWLKAQDGDRTATRAKVARRRKIGIAAACVVAFLYVLLKPSDIVGALQFGFFVGLAGFGWAMLAEWPMVTKIKSGMNGAIARALGLEYSVEALPGEAFERARRFAMLPHHHDAKFQDRWAGTLGELPFELHEAKLTEQRGSGKNRRTVTVFQGSLLTIAFARPFIGTTLIERDDEHRRFFGGEKESIDLAGLTLRRVAMVDPKFEEMFTVWSDDGVEARYLVHPDYVERLVAVQNAYGGQGLRALFHGGELLVALETADLFESGSIDASDDRRLLARTIDQFGSLADLAAKLNERPRASFN